MTPSPYVTWPLLTSLGFLLSLYQDTALPNFGLTHLMAILLAVPSTWKAFYLPELYLVDCFQDSCLMTEKEPEA